MPSDSSVKSDEKPSDEENLCISVKSVGQNPPTKKNHDEENLCISAKSVGQKTIICEKNKTQRRNNKKSAQALETCTLLSYITNVITFFIK